MSNDQPTRRPPAKSSGGGAPMGSTISIAIAVIAVVVGFLILRNISDSDSGGSSTVNPAVTTTSSPGGTDDTTQTTPPVDVSTTTPAPTFQGATVIVANASGTNGAAGQFMTALKNYGFTTADAATNATGTEQKLTTSKVYYVEGPGPLAVATSVAQAMGPGITAELIPTPAPVDNADLKTATVLVMLGSDLAGKPLYALSATTGNTTLPTSPIDNTTTSAPA